VVDLTSLAVYPAASWATTVQLFCSRVRVVTSGGIAAPYFQIIESHEAVDGGKLNYPVFVKPARSGSSFGVSKATNGDELSSALEAARKYDSKVLIEEGVVGSEIGCAILGNDDDLFVGEPDRVALSIYRLLGCRGLARVDMFLKEDGTVVLNEVNTLPGLTSYSRYPRMMQAAGLSFSEMIDRWVSLALAAR
jgi:D-alanine---(R)-lactate ligase